ncbi:MAG: hypothetical protein ACUVXA_19335 [Candidatus Jordarchaeum sp.]
MGKFRTTVITLFINRSAIMPVGIFSVIHGIIILIGVILVWKGEIGEQSS